jgi:hypothetical protein
MLRIDAIPFMTSCQILPCSPLIMCAQMEKVDFTSRIDKIEDRKNDGAIVPVY